MARTEPTRFPSVRIEDISRIDGPELRRSSHLGGRHRTRCTRFAPTVGNRSISLPLGTASGAQGLHRTTNLRTHGRPLTRRSTRRTPTVPSTATGTSSPTVAPTTKPTTTRPTSRGPETNPIRSRDRYTFQNQAKTFRDHRKAIELPGQTGFPTGPIWATIRSVSESDDTNISAHSPGCVLGSPVIR